MTQEQLNKSLTKFSSLGHIGMVKALLEAGANIQYGGALGMAAYYGHLEIVKLLIEYGAEIDFDNRYALKWATKKGHLEIVKYLEEHIEKRKYLGLKRLIALALKYVNL